MLFFSGFCGESLLASMVFSTSASGFFFFLFSMVVAGMDMGLLGWCFFSNGGGWGGLRVIERKREKEI